jgi:hypothetical protein
MREWSERLKRLVAQPSADVAVGTVEMLPEERRIWGILKTEMERATKGRAVGKCYFDREVNETEARMMGVVEGRDAMGVARQVVRRFDREGGLVAEVVMSRGVASVVVRMARQTEDGHGTVGT